MMFRDLVKQLGISTINVTRYDYESEKYINIGKERIYASMHFGTTRTLLNNPNAEVLAYIKVIDTLLFGVVRTKKKKLKGFKIFPSTQQGGHTIEELTPKKAVELIEKFKEAKPESYIQEKLKAEIIIEQI